MRRNSTFGRAPVRGFRGLSSMPMRGRIALFGFVFVAGLLALIPGLGTEASAQAAGFAFNEPPVAVFVYSPDAPLAGQSVYFDATGSYDPDGTIDRYEWDFTGDGRFDASGVTATWAFPEPGTYPVTLFVVDNAGTVGRTTIPVQVGALGIGPLDARFTYTPERPRPGQLVTFDGTVATGPGPAVTYEWDLDGDGLFESRGPVVSRTYARDGVYRVTLRVSDTMGRMAQHTEVVQIGRGLVRVVLESEPADLQVIINGIDRGRTPLTLELEPERHRVRLKHLWRGEWESELDLRFIDAVELRIVLR